ncbi:flagellar basal body rod protein FlgB [Clostridiaceae bacterium M8S5]|nr:flagellar basal body rod protein FlgB [Clostridiaceae bacterium M8S5]
MFNIAYDNVNFLKQALDGSWKRNEIINNNIANVNTPGFKRSRVQFEGILSKQLSKDDFELQTTNNNHIGINGNGEFKPLISKDKSFSTRLDGNNVNIDIENSESSKNYVYYVSVLKQMDSQFKRLKNIVSDGRK